MEIGGHLGEVVGIDVEGAAFETDFELPEGRTRREAGGHLQ